MIDRCMQIINNNCEVGLKVPPECWLAPKRSPSPLPGLLLAPPGLKPGGSDRPGWGGGVGCGAASRIPLEQR